MTTSVFDLFSIGIGPSSSHTVGPMRAAGRFAAALTDSGQLADTTRVVSELFGSLGATGHGHGSYNAVVWGSGGRGPRNRRHRCRAAARSGDQAHRPDAARRHPPIGFDPDNDLMLYRRRSLPFHPNGMTFTAYAGEPSRSANAPTTRSAAASSWTTTAPGTRRLIPDPTPVPYPFRTGTELLQLCTDNDLSISDVMLADECARRPEAEVRAGLLGIWRVMVECISNGCATPGVLPGGLKVRRRAADLQARLTDDAGRFRDMVDPLAAMDWVTLWALAVNEENASGGRVVTAPTNGAAGIIPAVLHYAVRFVPGTDDDAIVRFLLVAGALGAIYQQTASISGAEVGCQGEVGTACSMAAGALAEILGGSPEQVENAAEIGMEHHLGLTCDPVGGLVQIPCIERNAVGLGQGDHRGPARPVRRRPAHRQPGQGDQDDDADRRRHEGQVQGNRPRRPRRQHRRVLIGPVTAPWAVARTRTQHPDFAEIRMSPRTTDQTAVRAGSAHGNRRGDRRTLRRCEGWRPCCARFPLTSNSA